MKTHSITWVKVNAPVDKGIKDLVRPLSLFPKLQTIESCQGDSTRWPWVCFYYGSYWKHQWKELSDFVLGFLGPGIIRKKVGDVCNVSIKVTENGQILGEFFVNRDAIPKVTKAITKLYREYGS